MTPSNRKEITRRPYLNAIMRLQLRSLKRVRKAGDGEVSLWEVFQKDKSHFSARSKEEADPSKVLHERALELARPVQEYTFTESLANTLVFNRNNVQFALALNYVQEIIPLENLTYVPGVPAFVAGVVNARGKILTVVDLEFFLRLKERVVSSENETPSHSIVLVNPDDFEFGVFCDGYPFVNQHTRTFYKPIENEILDYKTLCLAGIDTAGTLLVDLPGLIRDADFLVNQL